MQRLIISILVGLTWIVQVQACTIPVYRYALERWDSDFYRMVVFYENELPVGISDKLTPLINTSIAIYGQLPADVNVQPKDVKSNMSLRFVDLANDPEPQMLELWQTQNHPELPWVVIRFPQSANMQHILWNGPSIALPESSLVQSPAREEIIEHLLNGKTAVWVLLETGNKEKDEKALDELTKALEQAKATLKLPEIGQQDEEQWLSGEDRIPLTIDFHIVRIARSNKQEIPFITMLIKSHPEMMEHLQEPMAFPIFGRGRVLSGLAGDEITESMITGMCKYLVESCQCQVKEENPGVDLLLTADWDQVYEILPAYAEPELLLTGVSNFLSSDDTTDIHSIPEDSVEIEQGKTFITQHILLLIGFGVVAVAALSFKLFGFK